MARLPPVLDTHDLPLAELCAARLDGELFAIDDGWAPLDEPDLPAFRAAVTALPCPKILALVRRNCSNNGSSQPPNPLGVSKRAVSLIARLCLLSLWNAPGAVLAELLRAQPTTPRIRSPPARM